MKKSKSIFMFLAVLAIAMLTLFSIGIAELNVFLMIGSIILFTAVFGYGMTLKKKYRENNWL